MIKKIFSLKFLKRLFLVLCFFYIGSCAFLYYNQERFYFHPKTLPTDYKYSFDTDFEEINIPVDKNNSLNSLLFKSKNTKGVILYLHGNAGAIHDWGKRAHLYTDNNYDVLFLDYRGYGKNHNQIESETMLHNDIQKVYDFLKSRYDEQQITVLGFSIGSGLAANVAANNNPKQLILEAPYYSFESLVKKIAPLVPSFLINYKIPTHEYIPKIKCPIIIFHGKDDFLIEPENSIALQKIKPEKIQVHFIDNCNHNGIYRSSYYFNKLPSILN